MQAHSLQYRGITVRFERDDLSRRSDDALAISCDLFMTFNSALCAAFVQLAGPQLHIAALQSISRYPQLYQFPPVPAAICVPGSGQLQTRHVILLPIGHSFAGLVQQVLTEMISAAIRCGAQSLAFPAIGTGGFRLLDHYEFSQALFDILKATQNFGSLQTLTLVTNNNYWTDQYYFEVNNLIVADQQAGANPPHNAANSSTQPGPARLPAVPNSLNQDNNANAPSLINPIPDLVNLNTPLSVPNFPSAGQFSQIFQNALNAQMGQNVLFSQTAPVNQNTASMSSAPATNQLCPFNTAFNIFDKKMVKELHVERLKERDEQTSTSSSKAIIDEDERLEPCPICLNDMLDDIENYDEDSDNTIVQTVYCSHKFHRFCLTEWFRNKTTCPVCSTPCMDIHGNQPIDGEMFCSNAPGDLGGYPGVGHIRIDYDIPSGIQTHPNPGVPYRGTTRVCYLPNNAEGRKVRDLLRLAFDRRLIFTVGQSITTGLDNVVTWNGIHHKTSKTGGATRFGYPDPTYLQRVKEELAMYGVTEALLDD